MRLLIVVGLMIASVCWGQDAAPNLEQQPAPQEQAQPPAAAPTQTVIVPAGTRIPLALASPITNKAARAGSAVRAVTGFPMTVGAQLAIPVGAYVDGVIDHVDKGGTSGPSLQMHFTRLIYPNGYTVALEGTNVQAKVLPPTPDSPDAPALQNAGGTAYAFAGQQSPPPLPPLPPLPHSGPNTGLIVGGVVGVAAAAILSVIFLGRHRGDTLLFDTGWQFDIVLQSPLSINTGSAAITAASAQ